MLEEERLAKQRLQEEEDEGYNALAGLVGRDGNSQDIGEIKEVPAENSDKDEN